MSSILRTNGALATTLAAVPFSTSSPWHPRRRGRPHRELGDVGQEVLEMHAARDQWRQSGNRGGQVMLARRNLLRDQHRPRLDLVCLFGGILTAAGCALPTSS